MTAAQTKVHKELKNAMFIYIRKEKLRKVRSKGQKQENNTPVRGTW